MFCRVVEMAVSEGSPAPSPQIVGNAFVEQYYCILHRSPEEVHKFYQDSSIFTRPEADGTATTVTTTEVSASNGLKSVIT